MKKRIALLITVFVMLFGCAAKETLPPSASVVKTMEFHTMEFHYTNGTLSVNLVLEGESYLVNKAAKHFIYTLRNNGYTLGDSGGECLDVYIGDTIHTGIINIDMISCSGVRCAGKGNSYTEAELEKALIAFEAKISN
jgi:hypothetical protein